MKKSVPVATSPITVSVMRKVIGVVFAISASAGEKTSTRTSRVVSGPTPITGLPFTVVLLLMCFSLYKGLSAERKLMTANP